MTRELAAQVLDDGFHVERSPGYHAVLVDDLVRLERLLGAKGERQSAFGRVVTEARRRTAAALASVVHPDGEIPLFNDAAFGQAPETAWILARSAELDEGGTTPADPPGEIGPDDQPGHAHADTLSYELSFGRTRVVVDAGVFDYAATAKRAYARGTRGHNTVELDGLDQSEMWGVFRVGRRARPFAVRRDEVSGLVAIEASHDGYRHLPGRPVHRRRMEHAGGDVWRVEDVVLGHGEHRAISRIRLHPAMRIGKREAGRLEASDGETTLHVIAESPGRLDVEEGSYFPRFGAEDGCSVIRLEADGTLPLRLGYRLELSTRS